MGNTIFAELKFWLMVLASVVLPFGMYAVLMTKRAISRRTTLLLGFALVAVAGMDVYFLRILARLAKVTPSITDDGVFVSEISIALYLLPAMFGGIGVNVISHVLLRHLDEANRQFNHDHPKK
jgi:hypothetical protein